MLPYWRNGTAVRAWLGEHVGRLGLATRQIRRTAKPGQSRSVRRVCGRSGRVDAVALPSATAAKVTAVLIKCCQDMLTERRRYITK